jgi:hypothetical protein
MERLLSRLSVIDAPAGLYERVLACIDTARIRRARLRFSMAAVASVAALATAVPALMSAIAASSSTGFGQYLSLAVTDPDVAFSNLASFILSVASAAPVLSFAAVAACALVIIASTREILRSIPSARLSSLLISA